MSNYASIDVLVRFIVPFTLYDNARTKKEETPMLRTNTQKANFWSQPHIALPNAATRREVLHKVLDNLLIAASCAGAVAIMLFFVVITL